MYERVQYKGFGDTISQDSIQVTLDNQPQVGNLLLLNFVSRHNNVPTLPSGWNVLWDVENNFRNVCAYKIAEENEPKTITITTLYSRDLCLLVEERHAIEEISSVVYNHSGTEVVTVLSSGTINDLTEVPQHAIAMFAVQNGVFGGEIFSNDFEQGVQVGANSGTKPYIITAEKAITSLEEVETTLTITIDRRLIGGLITIIPGETPDLVAGNLTHKSRRAESVTLEWTDSVGGLPPRTSQLQISPTGQNDWKDVSDATISPATATSLTNNTAYDFRVRYEDSEDRVAYSNIVTATTSNVPIAIIEDDERNQTGTITRMGPCFVGFKMTDSEFGAGDFGNILPEWTFDDEDSKYNYLRGFSAGHIYDIEEGATKTVTLNLTNVDQLSDSTTRTVVITPNTRTKIYIDPDLGSSNPSNPSDPSDPFDTPASAWAGTSGSDIEFILTAGKTHTWTTEFNCNGSRHNILIRSSQKGTKANISATSSVILSRGNFLGVRDLHFISGGSNSPIQILNARYTSNRPACACWALDCTSDDIMVIPGITDHTSYFNLWQNVQTRDETNLNSLWGAGEGTIVIGCHFQHGNQTLNVERPIRAKGDHVLIWDTTTISNCYKNAFTRNGGKWLWIHGCNFSNISGLGGVASFTHNSGLSEGAVEFVVVERTIMTSPYGIAGDKAVIGLAGADQELHGAVFRNIIVCDGSIHAKQIDFNDGQLIKDIRIYNTTIKHNHYNNTFVYFNDHTNRNLIINGNLGVTDGLRTFASIQIKGDADLVLQNPLLKENVMPPTNSGLDVYTGFSSESFADWNARDPNYGTGNIAKTITLDENYRPTDMEDGDLIIEMPLDMINFQEDYYGNPRSTDKWHVGAVSLDHIQPEDPDLPSKPMAYERVQYKGKNQNRISDLDYITVTLDRKPTEGNLLLLFFGSRYGTTVTLPDGWTEVWRQNDSVISCCAYKIAGNNESQDVTVNISTIRDIVLVVEERYPPESIDRVVVNSTEGVGVNQLSTGPTDVLSTSPQHAIAVVTVQDGSRGGEEFSDGFVETIRQETSDPGSTIQPFIIIAEKELNSTDPVETTISITNNRLMIVGLLTIIPGDIPEHTPGTLSQKTRRGDSITVQWTDSVGGVAPRTSQLQISPTGQNSWVDVENAISSPSTVANLSDDTTYDFRVKYNDANDNIVYSNIISETTSNKPIAIIEDDQYNTEGVIERMGPCMIGFLMTDSEFGAGDSSNIKPEWDFGDSGSRYNELRGFSAAHFYDIDESYDVEKTVTLKLTNADQEQDIATRTVRIKANTRTKIYIDPDLGSPSPTDPSDPNDPFDTPANAWNGTSGSDLEFILTAGKTHIWDTAFNGSGSRHNILVRSSIKGVKANVSVTSGFVIGGANQHGIRDIHFVTGGRQEWFRMLDARYTSLNKSSFCWVLDCTSEDAMCAVGITSDASYFTLFQNVQSDDKTNINSLWGEGKGTIILGCNIRHGDGTLNVERPIRAKGDNILVHDTTCIANTYKSAFTRNGGRWLWISGCRFIQENAGVALGLTHNHEDIEGRVENVVVEKTLIKSYGTDGSHASIALAGSNQSAREVVVRNCIIDGGIIHAKMDFDEGQLLEDIRFYNLTIIHEKPDIQPITFIEPLHRNTKVSGCLAIASLVNSWSIRMICDPDLVLQNPYIHQNVMPIAQEDGDIYTGSLESWSTWNQRNPNYGTGNLSKNIILDELYRSVEDTDLIVDMPTDMINFQEDYYGSKRDPDNWVAGAVSFFPILESDMYVGSQQVVRLYVGSQEVQTVY